MFSETTLTVEAPASPTELYVGDELLEDAISNELKAKNTFIEPSPSSSADDYLDYVKKFYGDGDWKIDTSFQSGPIQKFDSENLDITYIDESDGSESSQREFSKKNGNIKYFEKHITDLQTTGISIVEKRLDEKTLSVVLHIKNGDQIKTFSFTKELIFEFNSLEEVVAANGPKGSDWFEAETSINSLMLSKTSIDGKGSGKQDEQTWSLLRAQGWAEKKETDLKTGKQTHTLYFTDAKGQVSYKVFTEDRERTYNLDDYDDGDIPEPNSKSNNIERETVLSFQNIDNSSGSIFASSFQKQPSLANEVNLNLWSALFNPNVVVKNYNPEHREEPGSKAIELLSLTPKEISEPNQYPLPEVIEDRQGGIFEEDSVRDFEHSKVQSQDLVDSGISLSVEPTPPLESINVRLVDKRSASIFSPEIKSPPEADITTGQESDETGAKSNFLELTIPGLAEKSLASGINETNKVFEQPDIVSEKRVTDEVPVDKYLDKEQTFDLDLAVAFDKLDIIPELSIKADQSPQITKQEAAVKSNEATKRDYRDDQERRLKNIDQINDGEEVTQKPSADEIMSTSIEDVNLQFTNNEKILIIDTSNRQKEVSGTPVGTEIFGFSSENTEDDQEALAQGQESKIETLPLQRELNALTKLIRQESGNKIVSAENTVTPKQRLQEYSENKETESLGTKREAKPVLIQNRFEQQRKRITEPKNSNLLELQALLTLNKSEIEITGQKSASFKPPLYNSPIFAKNLTSQEKSRKDSVKESKRYIFGESFSKSGVRQSAKPVQDINDAIQAAQDSAIKIAA